jgi:hypothetical protein
MGYIMTTTRTVIMTPTEWNAIILSRSSKSQKCHSQKCTGTEDGDSPLKSVTFLQILSLHQVVGARRGFTKEQCSSLKICFSGGQAGVSNEPIFLQK